jgi:hypothetical protein
MINRPAESLDCPLIPKVLAFEIQIIGLVALGRYGLPGWPDVCVVPQGDLDLA